MLVTRSTDVVLSDRAPALVAPAGAVRFTASVRPAGMFDPMPAVILAPVWFVVTAHVAAAVAPVGALPAVAVLMTSEGLPEKAIWLIASTWKVMVCVAVCADAALTALTTNAIVDRMRLVIAYLWRRILSLDCALRVTLPRLHQSFARITLSSLILFTALRCRHSAD